MKTAELASLLRDVKQLLMQLEGDPKPRVVVAFDHLTDLADHAYGRGGSGGGRSNGHSDPTGQAFFDQQRKDDSQRIIDDRNDMADALLGAKHKLKLAVKYQEAALDPKHPIQHKPGCEVCDTVRADDGQPHHLSWQPVKARGLCGWHYRFQYGDGPSAPGYGVSPTAELNRFHLDHPADELRPSMVRDHMPEAFAAREARKRKPGLCHQPCGKTNEPCVRPFLHVGPCASELVEAPA